MKEALELVREIFNGLDDGEISVDVVWVNRANKLLSQYYEIDDLGMARTFKKRNQKRLSPPKNKKIRARGRG